MEVDRTRRWGGVSGPRPLVCYKCGQEGHRQYECPNSARASNIRSVQPEDVTTTTSTSDGHKDTKDFAEDQAVEA